jgi:DNA repair protein RadC
LNARRKKVDHFNLDDLQLLALVIGKRSAKKLYTGTLAPLLLRSCEQGYSHIRLAAAKELVRRSLVEELKREPVLSNPSVVKDYLRIVLAAREYECFVALFLDAQNRLIAAEELFRGTLTQTSVFPREVVKRALTVNAAGVVFAHNHPSGVPEPSHADELLTIQLKQGLALVDIRVLDHFIVAGPEIVSFAEKGLL